MPALRNKPSQYSKLRVLVSILLLIFLIGLTVILLIYRDEVQQLQSFGYPGIFLVSLLSNATIIFPIPGVVFTSAMGAVFHPFWVAVAAGSGAAVGELSGYLAGVSGQIVLDRSEGYDKVYNWMQRYGYWTLILLAFVPNPLFDIAGFVAGSLKLPIWKFLLACLIGKIGKMLLFAYLGAGIFSVFE